jgi:hypothetical protein
VNGKMSETDLNRVIRALCERLGLYAFGMESYRIPGARSARPGSSKGYPDWTIAGPAGILFREAKSEDGRRSMAQVQWGKQIERAGGNYAIWRPSDLASGQIERELKALAGA